MDRNENLRKRVVSLIAEIVEVETSSVGPSDRLREDLGMDSLASLELLSVLSEELRLDLEMEAAMAISTVEDACSFIEAQVAAGSLVLSPTEAHG